MDAALGRPLAGLVPTLVTTLGADGAQVETAEGRIASPGFTPKILDTTGAGDCFAAACLHSRLAAKTGLERSPSLRQWRRGDLNHRARRAVGLADRRSSRRVSVSDAGRKLIPATGSAPSALDLSQRSNDRAAVSPFPSPF